MGCHTWYKIPIETDKERIKEFAREYLQRTDDRSLYPDYKKMYTFAVENELSAPTCELAACLLNCGTEVRIPWALFRNSYDHAVIEYNKTHGTSYDKYDKFFTDNDVLEFFGTWPRIEGYPDIIILSYDDMCDFMRDGFIGNNGKHYNFDLKDDADRKEAKEYVKRFFEKYPQGIITFG